MSNTVNKKQIIKRGFFNTCPKCGVGKILHGYITPYDACSHCAQDFNVLRADDGPAWLTVLITGHLTMPFVFFMLEWNLDKLWLEILLPCLLIVGLSAIILPRAKGVFMAIIWMMIIKKDTDQDIAEPACDAAS